MERHEEVPVVFGPTGLAYNAAKLGGTDWGAAICLVFVTLFLNAQMGILGFLIGIGVIVSLLWPLGWSKRYYAIGEWLAGVFIHVFLRDALWLAENDPNEGFFRKLCRWLYNRCTHHAYPYRVDTLYDYGLVYTKPMSTDSVIITGDGSDIAGLSLQEQANRAEWIAEEIRRNVSYEGLEVTTSMVFSRRPLDMIDVLAVQNASMHPNVLWPEALLVLAENPGRSADDLYKAGLLTRQQLRDYRLHKVNVVQARALLGERGMTPIMAYVITVNRSTRLQAAEPKRRGQGKPLDESELRFEKIIQIAQASSDALRKAGVGNPRVLTPRQAEAYLRVWDVAGLPSFFERQLEETGHGLHHPEHAIMAQSDVAVFDQTGHATVRLTVPPQHVTPNTMPQLVTQSEVPWLTRTIVCESTTGKWEYRGTYFLGNLVDILMSVFSGIRPGAKSIRRRQKLDAAEERIADESHILYLNVFESCAHDDPKVLEMYVDMLQREIRSIGGKSERLKGRARIVPWTLTALTGIPVRR